MNRSFHYSRIISRSRSYGQCPLKFLSKRHTVFQSYSRLSDFPAWSFMFSADLTAVLLSAVLSCSSAPGPSQGLRRLMRTGHISRRPWPLVSNWIWLGGGTFRKAGGRRRQMFEGLFACSLFAGCHRCYVSPVPDHTLSVPLSPRPALGHHGSLHWP